MLIRWIMLDMGSLLVGRAAPRESLNSGEREDIVDFQLIDGGLDILWVFGCLICDYVVAESYDVAVRMCFGEER